MTHTPKVLSLLIAIILFSTVGSTASAQTPPSWEGQIAYLGGDGNLWVLRSDNPQPLQITADASEQRHYYSPRFSPAGDLLAFCRTDASNGGSSQVYIMRVGAWQPILLVEDVFCQGFPQVGFDWSPDGTSIAYTRSFYYAPQADGSQWSIYHGIWNVDITTGETQELVAPPGTNPLVYPLWSPDGRWIRLYELVYQEGLGVLRTWNRDSGALYNWLNVGLDLFPGSADWSPDSSRLAFDQVTYLGYPGAGLFAAAPDVSGVQQVFADPNKGVAQPSWSPDGANIAFSLNTYYRNEMSSLALIAPDGSNLREVYQIQANLVLLDWSPSGSQLLYVTDESGHSDLYIYDLASSTRFQVVAGSGWQANWGRLPKTNAPESSQIPSQVEGFEASGGSLLAYVGENYQLNIYDPLNGSRGELSPPLSAVTFWHSPSGLHLVYADRLLNLSFREGGGLSVQQVTLPNFPVGEQINWAPGEGRLAYQDAQAHVWLVDIGGDFIEIPGATSLPGWSFESRFMSYCTEGDRLWVVGGGISLREVASPVDCQASWSSSQDLLAYTLKGSSGPGSDQVYLYDPELGKSQLVLDKASLESWSPDGKLLAMRQAGKTGSASYAVYASDPLGGDPLELGQMSGLEPGLKGWADTTAAHIFGPYQIAENLRSSEKVAQILYDVSQDGQVLLTGTRTAMAYEIICLDTTVGQPVTTVNTDMTGLPPTERPGIWASLSPDGSWTASSNYESGDYHYLLTRCDRTRQANLESSPDVSGDGFSSDSRWYVQRVPGESRSGQMLVYELATLNRDSLPALSSSPAVWIAPPRGVIQNGYAVSGKVVAEDGTPEAAVNILVDGQPAATTEEDGGFVIDGLNAGDYEITALKGELKFNPRVQKITLPGDEQEIVFTMQSSASGSAAEITQETGTGETAPAEVGGAPTEAESAASAPDGVVASLFLNEVWLYGLGILLVLLLLVVLVVRIFRRRRRSGEPAAPGTGEPAAGDRSTAASKAATPAEVSASLRLGVDKVKDGQNEEGLQILQQVLAQDPDNALAWLWSGMASTKLKDWSAAERSFKRAKKLGHPKADQALRWLKEQQDFG